jgi:hypothetical protein
MSNSKRIISLTVVCLFTLAAIIVNRAATRALSFTQTPQPTPKSQQEREALAKTPDTYSATTLTSKGLTCAPTRG